MKRFLKVIFMGLTAVFFLFLLFIIVFVWHMRVQDVRFRESISYSRLKYLASGIEDYHNQYGQFPTNMTQLKTCRPDMVECTVDYYGRPIMFVPYNEAAGFGELISHRGDTESMDSNVITIRFPLGSPTNMQWNANVGKEFKNPHNLP